MTINIKKTGRGFILTIKRNGLTFTFPKPYASESNAVSAAALWLEGNI